MNIDLRTSNLPSFMQASLPAHGWGGWGGTESGGSDDTKDAHPGHNTDGHWGKQPPPSPAASPSTDVESEGPPDAGAMRCCRKSAL